MVVHAVGSTNPCVSVQDTYMHYYYGLPPLPGWDSISQEYGEDAWTSRNVLIFKLLITCPGIWILENSSFTYTTIFSYLPGYNETNIMTMVDLENSFPLVIPENEQVEVLVAWDFYADMPPGHLSTAASNAQTAFDYCISLPSVPYLPPDTPPPPPPPVPWPLPEGAVPPPPGTDEGLPPPVSTEGDPSEEDTGGTDGGAASDGSTSDSAGCPGPYDPLNPTDPADMPANSILPKLPKKFDVRGKTLGDTRRRIKRPGMRGPLKTKNIATYIKPVARIMERRELVAGQIHGSSLAGLRPAGGTNISGPGQVPLTANERTVNIAGSNSGVINSAISIIGNESIVGSRTYVITKTASSLSIGDTLNFNSKISNPIADISAFEPIGAGSSDPNRYVYKDPQAGSRKEIVPKYHGRAIDKVDSRGIPIKANQFKKDGKADANSTQGFNLFKVNFPKDHDWQKKSISRKSTRPLAPTSANQDYQIPSATDDWNIADDSNVIYNYGSGLFYGVGPFEHFESDEVFNAIHDEVRKRAGATIFVTVNDSSVVESQTVTPASIGIMNTSEHRTEYGALIVIGILDSNLVFRYLGYQKINILTRSYQFMNVPIPPSSPGHTQIIGMVFSSNNRLLLSAKKSVIIAPDGYTVEGYTPQSPLLPGSLADLTNNPTERYRSRVFPRPNELRRVLASSDTVDFVVKIPQVASSRGLNSKITVTDGYTTGSSSNRFMIDGIEIFPGAHDCYLQYSTESGRSIDVQVTDIENKLHSTYSYSMLGTSLEHPTDLIFSGIANNSGYLGGAIQTPIINGLVVLSNNRTNSNVMVGTKQDGVLLLSTTGGYTGTPDGSIVQVDTTEVPYLGFNSLPGDEIVIRAQGPAGQYDDIIAINTLTYDTGLALPTIPYTMPDEPVFPGTIPGVNMNGDILPPIETGGPWEIPDDTAGDPPPSPPPPPPPPPPIGGDDGECSENSLTNEWKSVIVQICQRPSNPCIIDIAIDLYMCDENGDPVMVSNPLNSVQILYGLCAFSLDSTDGVNGTWHELKPLISDNQHTGLVLISLPGTYNYVADMCDHFSSFFSISSMMFRLAFRMGAVNGDGNYNPNCSDGEIGL
jgi:hypothetical protein